MLMDTYDYSDRTVDQSQVKWIKYRMFFLRISLQINNDSYQVKYDVNVSAIMLHL